MKILIAEDERDIRNLVKISLEENGYTVFAAENGLQALELLQNQSFDLAVIDVLMPMLDGFNLLRKIRESSTIPVIFLSARASDMDKVLGLGLGADDYLTKPFSMSELLARVASQLRRNHDYRFSAEKSASVIRYGELSLDKVKCSVCKGGEALELNVKEYKLLLFFMEHPERVFTKQQLYKAVWDDEYLFDDNTVMVHISRLRSKIEPDPQNPKYLKTIRGIGYKLEVTGEVL
jgi:DNA-binding response OmpR family regulator